MLCTLFTADVFLLDDKGLPEEDNGNDDDDSEDDEEDDDEEVKSVFIDSMAALFTES